MAVDATLADKNKNNDGMTVMTDTVEKTADDATEALLTTPLTDLHIELGAKMVEFAGYNMPVSYPQGTIREHMAARNHAALFDVSHMGQVRIYGPDRVKLMESLTPAALQELKPTRGVYTMLLNESGGILDDLIISHADDHLYVVINASRKSQDLEVIRDAATAMKADVEIQYLPDLALMALQGPKAAEVLSHHVAFCDVMRFMSGMEGHVNGHRLWITRCGYTGEDGYEISCDADAAPEIARLLLEHEEVRPAGLAARDSLRLEAGLCLYGHDITTATTPVEAGLTFTIGKRRRAEGGFPGHEKIMRQLSEGVASKRIGLVPDSRIPAREGAPITDAAGNRLGTVTSGTFGPSLEKPVAMGYIASAHAEPGTEVMLTVRDKQIPATVTKLPFVEQRYYRGPYRL
ncbi:MAG: glycine cleavage system aminomethyltransferase GcvT [Alphaproteobacteria bacterium]